MESALQWLTDFVADPLYFLLISGVIAAIIYAIIANVDQSKEK